MIVHNVNRRSRGRPSGVPRTSAPSRKALAVARLSAANDNRRIQNSALRVAINPRRLARFGRILLRASAPIRLAENALDLYDIFSGSQPEGWINLGPWVERGKCASPSPQYSGPMAQAGYSSLENSYLHNWTNSCSAGSVPLNLDPWADLDRRRSVAIGGTRVMPGGVLHCQFQYSFSRPDRGPFEKPVWQDAKAPVITPNLPVNWSGSADPSIYPPNQAPAFPPPVPLSLNKDWRAPNRRTVTGRRPLPLGVVPNEWSREIVFKPGHGTAPSASAPPTHTMRPPGRNTKERKIKAGKAVATALRVMSTGTEALDLIDVLYQAIPRDLRPRWKNTIYERYNVSYAEKLQTIYNHLDQMDYEEALVGFAENHVEDMAYGTLGQFGGTASQNVGRMYGAGFNTLQKRFSDDMYSIDYDKAFPYHDEIPYMGEQ